MNNKSIAIVLFIVVIFGGTYLSRKTKTPIGPVACTMEAKLCPDGSSVGRTGPNCEFTACPNIQVSKETGTVSGTVTMGPTCPVERIPPEPQCAPRPYSTTINIREVNKTTIIKNIQSDNLGIFKTNLAPGSYELDAITANGSILPRCNKITVVIKANQTTTADISCDTGIR